MKEPKLRFKGFRGEWETTNIASVASLKAGVSIDTSQEISYQIQGYYPCYGGNGLRGYVRDYTHDGIYNIIGRQGALCGNVRIVTGKFHATEHAVVVTPIKKLNPYFLFNVLTKANINQYATGVAQPGLSVQNVNKRLYIHIPNFDEQQSIASYLQHLDSLIQSTTKKIESLKQVKAASLQSMFPQEGETTPRVRFKGFEGEWEKKTLGDCLTINNERNQNNVYGINDVLSVSDEVGVVNQIKLLGRSYAGKSVVNYRVLKTKQIVYTKSPLKSKPYGIIKVNKGDIGIVSVLYAVYDANENVYPDYIHYYFDPIHRINNYLLPLINKGAKNTMNISDEMALTGNIWIPSLEEQKKIADYLQALDSQITLQTLRLEKLKQIKAACLDKMFV